MGARRVPFPAEPTLRLGRNGQGVVRSPAAGQGGSVQACDVRRPCPPGFTCLWSRAVLGTKVSRPSDRLDESRGGDVEACYAGASVERRRQGACPTNTLASSFRSQWAPHLPSRVPIPIPTPPSRCQFDVDCPAGLRCCPAGATTACLTPRPIPVQPTLTILMEGAFRPPPAGQTGFVSPSYPALSPPIAMPSRLTGPGHVHEPHPKQRPQHHLRLRRAPRPGRPP